MGYLKKLLLKWFNRWYIIQVKNIESHKETIDMAKKETPAEENQPLNSLALGVARNEKGTWCVVKLKFNLSTGEAKVEETVSAGVFSEATERFKILAAEDIFTSQEQ